MVRLLLLITFFPLWNGQSQNSKLFFSEALDIHLPTYLSEVERAISVLDQKKVEILFDSLVENRLNGSIMNNFIVKNGDTRKVSLDQYNKPVLLLTNSSWRLRCKGELEALNELAEKYKEEIDIVLLFWGTNEEVRKFSKEYRRTIDILYVNDMDNNYTLIIKNLKHSLGLPLAYTLTSGKEIIDIKKRKTNQIKQPIEEAIQHNFLMYNTMITSLLTQEAVLSPTSTLTKE